MGIGNDPATCIPSCKFSDNMNSINSGLIFGYMHVDHVSKFCEHVCIMSALINFWIDPSR